MTPTNEAASYQTALAIMEQLVASGVSRIVVSPGYRNAPLLLAAHQQEGLEAITAVDERAAAFLALGLARAGEPVAVACTSGTAVANYFPAVMEASHSHLPLVVVTADRPVELIGTGANQCTDQTRSFGIHVRFFAEVACADPSFSAENQARYCVAQAVAQATAPRPGPVHLNVRFREPFLPEATTVPQIQAARSAPATRWKILPAASGPSRAQVEAISAMVGEARRPLFLVGPVDFSQARLDAIAQLASRTGVPVLAENASGLPFRAERGCPVASQVEPIFSAFQSGELPSPDLVLRFGPPLTGKGLGRLIQAVPLPQVVFDEWGEAREPHLHPSILAQGGIDGWIAALTEMRASALETNWATRLTHASKEFFVAVSEALVDAPFTESLFHHQLSEKLPDQSVIFLGNSMPIRDFNRAFHEEGKSFRVHANRGLSGIDGLIASAVGVALAADRDAHAILGDLSTLHDISSLSLLSSLRDRLRLTLWVMNNGGGEIFRIVPTAKTAGRSEWFTTPQTYELAALARAFQLSFARVCTRADWQALDAEACNGPGVRLIEVVVDKEANLAVRRTLPYSG